MVEPTEPIERNEFADAIDRNESSDHRQSAESATARS